MIKRIPKILKLIFVLIFVFQLIGLAVLFALPEMTQAADINFKPQITIPGFDTEAKNAGMEGSETSGYSINGNSIGVLIKSIYKYAIGIVGILATIIMMIGGFMWLIAGGNQSKISEAQEWIKASLTGLVLALGSYMILTTVNPALTTFKKLKIQTVSPIPSSLNTSTSTTKKMGPGGTGGSQYQWKKLSTNQNCKDKIGTGWVIVDDKNCTATKPDFTHTCCGKF